MTSLLRILKGSFHIFFWEVREPARAVLWGVRDTVYTVPSVGRGQREKQLRAKEDLWRAGRLPNLAGNCRHLQRESPELYLAAPDQQESL